MTSWLNQAVTQVLPLAPKSLVRRFSARYIAGETIEDLLDTVRRLNAEGCMATVDVLGEFIRYTSEARAAAAIYQTVLARLAEERLDANISVKLSQMGLLINPDLCEAIMDELVTLAAETGNFVRIDMEDSPCTSATIDLYLKLRQRHSNVGIVLQAMLRRTMADTHRIIEAGAGHFRLCKGIYREPRRRAYQDTGVIHKNYVHLLDTMFEQGAYVGIATHHEDLIWEARRLIAQHGLAREQYEFQMLLGVEPELRSLLLEEGHRVRVYVPFGPQWHAYSMRRLKENPAIVGHLLKNLLVRT
jgi:proline dehydrogenase